MDLAVTLSLLFFISRLLFFFNLPEALHEMCVQMCVYPQYANNYFLTADPESAGTQTECRLQPPSRSVCLWEMFSVPPEQFEAPLDGPLQGTLFIPRFCQMITV